MRMQEIKDIKHLLDRLTKNDAQAFRQIFRAYSDRVYSFSLKLTRSQIAAEETVQEVFMKLWVNRASLAGIENFQAYLYTITRNLVFNSLKRSAIEAQVKATLMQELDKKHSDTEETVIHRDYQQLLNRAISHLPPQQRLVYSLCHQQGLRYEEVAQQLNISRLTVKTHMQQALRTIKSQFAHIIRVSFLFISLYC
jgi:RNA polymerase sigma-70 factor (ECF subfamily)